MAATMNAATFMGKDFQDNQNSIMDTSDLTLKKMFDIFAKLVGEQDEIFKVDSIPWKKHSWKYLSLIGDETVINLQRAKVYVFSDSVLCNERECLANAKVVSVYAKKFGIGQWSFIGPGSEKKWYSMEEDSPQGI